MSQEELETIYSTLNSQVKIVEDDEDEKPVKRGPGRPPNKKKNPAIPHCGVQASPKIDGNLIEFSSDCPGIFKTIFTFIKLIKIPEIHMKFTPNSFKIFGRDHTGNSICVVQIDCSNAIWYYCKQDYTLFFDTQIITSVIKKMNKDDLKISFLYKSIYEGEKFMIVQTLNSGPKNESFITLLPACCETNLDDLYDKERYFEIENTQEDFDLNFSIDKKSFKTLVSNAEKDRSIIVNAVKGTRITINYDTPDKQQKMEIPLKEGQLKDAYCRTVISVQTLKHIPKSVLNDKEPITIYCNTDNVTIFETTCEGFGTLITYCDNQDNY